MFCVPKSLKSEPFRDQQRVKTGPKMWFSASMRELAKVLKHIFFSSFRGRFVDFWTPYTSQRLVERGKMHRNVLE